MLYPKIHTIYRTEKLIGKSSAAYRLYELSDEDGRDYLFCVKFKGMVNRCTLGGETMEEAGQRFSLLVRGSTTPLSLDDTVHDLFE